MRASTHNKMEYVKDLTWEDVFEIWRQNEEGRQNWIEHFQSRGFKSWEEWRKTYVKPLGLPNRQYKLYSVINPEQTVLTFHGGPFRSWTERFYGDTHVPTFAEFASLSQIQEHPGIQEIMNNFPTDTVVTGVTTDDGVVIVEGMHRCCAVALAARQGRRIASGFHIALADYKPGVLPMVGRHQAQEKKEMTSDPG